jgi:hypothetical protein
VKDSAPRIVSFSQKSAIVNEGIKGDNRHYVNFRARKSLVFTIVFPSEKAPQIAHVFDVHQREVYGLP